MIIKYYRKHATTALCMKTEGRSYRGLKRASGRDTAVVGTRPGWPAGPGEIPGTWELGMTNEH